MLALTSMPPNFTPGQYRQQSASAGKAAAVAGLRTETNEAIVVRVVNTAPMASRKAVRTDDKTAANPARPEDYEPTFFQGSIAAPVRAAWRKALPASRSVCRRFSKRLISLSCIHRRRCADGQYLPRDVPG